MERTLIWRRTSEGHYDAELDGKVVGAAYHGGSRGYRWSWYADSKSGDSETLANAKEAVSLRLGIQPPEPDFERERQRAAARHERMMAESERRNKIADVFALRRAAKVMERRGQILSAVHANDLAAEIEKEYQP